jgi:dTDP-4-amino-4,6-dideoxygalactose transaminase
MRPQIDNRELTLIKKVLDSKVLTEGVITKEFEERVAKYVGTKYAIATTSATTALHACFESLNIQGKKVLVSDFTFPATVQAIVLAGGIPVLVDVDLESMNITSDIIENSITDKINVISPVALFGNSLDNKIYTLRKKNIRIVEDAATNLGTKLGSHYTGKLADLTCFSFHPRKIITTGEGGMITTDDSVLAKKITSYKTFGKTDNKFVTMGTNYKISDVLSAIGLAQMSKLEPIIKKRLAMAKIYDELISKIDILQPQKPTKNSRHTYQSYVCRVTKPNLRNKIIKKLAQNNIESQIGTYALHCLPAFAKTKRLGSLSNSETLYKNTITLPLHAELDTPDQETICKIIKNL